MIVGIAVETIGGLQRGQRGHQQEGEGHGADLVRREPGAGVFEGGGRGGPGLGTQDGSEPVAMLRVRVTRA